MLKHILLAALAILILTSPNFAQKRDRMKAMQKMEELKKIKLIDVLQLDEETSIKFFTRRSEHIKKIEELIQLRNDKIDKIEDILKSDESNNESILTKEINDFHQLEEKEFQERQRFLKSASEILTPEQMAKLIVFEERFRRDVSGLLFRERFKKFRND
jgi:hypothetical protein